MPHQMTTTGMGVAVSLITERSEYPRDALVRATVQIENVTDRPITVRQFKADSPLITVEDADGRPAGNSANPFPNRPGHSSGPRPSRHTLLQPGESISRQLYVIASAKYLRVHVALVFPSGVNEWTPSIDGDRLHLSLLDAEPPRAILREHPSLAAEIVPHGPVQGQLVYQYWLASKRAPGTTDGMMIAGSRQWIPAEGTTLVPDWEGHGLFEREWHVVAGWEGWPVARIDYIES